MAPLDIKITKILRSQNFFSAEPWLATIFVPRPQGTRRAASSLTPTAMSVVPCPYLVSVSNKISKDPLPSSSQLIKRLKFGSMGGIDSQKY